MPGGGGQQIEAISITLASSNVLECSIAPISPDDAFRTGLPLGTPMMTLVRLRMAGGEALSYERAMVPVETVGPTYDGSGSLYERMDERNARPRRILQSLQAIEGTIRARVLF